MKILQPYIGRFVSAKSASSKLDDEAIVAGCNGVDSEVSGISNVVSKIDSEGNTVDSSALSVDDVTIVHYHLAVKE